MIFVRGLNYSEDLSLRRSEHIGPGGLLQGRPGQLSVG